MDIEIKDLNVSVDKKTVLNNFNLNIKKGEIHVIMGPNGVGKSTLSNVIMGNDKYKVTSGKILCDGTSINDLDTCSRAKLGIFLSFQNPLEIEGISNSEFLRSAVNSKNGSIVGLYDFISEVEKHFSSLNLKKDMMHRELNKNFSGGEKKKNEILQMKMLKPKFIILDELDSGLDVDSLKIVCSNVNDYLEKNPDTSVLMITHYPRILDFIKPNFVHVIVGGKIVKSGDIALAKEIDKYGYDFVNSGTSLVGDK